MSSSGPLSGADFDVLSQQHAHGMCCLVAIHYTIDGQHDAPYIAMHDVHCKETRPI